MFLFVCAPGAYKCPKTNHISTDVLCQPVFCHFPLFFSYFNLIFVDFSCFSIKNSEAQEKKLLFRPRSRKSNQISTALFPSHIRTCQTVVKYLIHSAPSITTLSGWVKDVIFLSNNRLTFAGNSSSPSQKIIRKGTQKNAGI